MAICFRHYHSFVLRLRLEEPAGRSLPRQKPANVLRKLRRPLQHVKYMIPYT